MAATVEQGVLVLADITGYSAYLSRSEIEHAPTIAGDLLETVVGRLEPPFRLAKIEGDAVFVFTEDGRAEPALLVDAIETAYLAFRRRLRSIQGATTCDCKACGLAPRLDLKVFVHHGSYVHSRIAGRDELAGADVVLAHRLLKGTTAEQMQGRGFALFTDGALAALGIDPVRMGMLATTEVLEGMEPVGAHVLDLEAHWQANSGRRLLGHAGRRVFHEQLVLVPVDRARAWSYLTAPDMRSTWEGRITFADKDAGGRLGPGRTTRCVTGRLASIEEIVDWQPFDYVGWRVAVPGIGAVETTADLAPADSGGTHLRLRWSIDAGQRPSKVALDAFGRQKSRAIARLLQAVGNDRQLQEVTNR